MPKKIDLKDLPWDPFDRKRIIEYHHDQRDEIRRTYLIRGPCESLGHAFSKLIKIGIKIDILTPSIMKNIRIDSCIE